MRYGLAPSGRFYLRASSLKISLPCEETDRKAVLLALVIAALCICGLASPPTPLFHSKGRAARAYPNLHPLVARQLGIRIMYSPPLRPARSMVTPIRPLVVRCTHNFAGALLYCSNLRMRLRRR
ncbi:MAG: hypothetical protein V8Q91_17655 [Bilophila wadsworthia]|uniref:hypothetical protein n=1 Tax=Bilophila wadsworthia TaxID=35833 RepID=UPI00300E7B4C